MGPPSDNQTPAHRLTDIEGIPGSVLVALERQWIETAEQVLAAASSEHGCTGLRDLLGFDRDELNGLLDSLRTAVGPDVCARVERCAPGGATGVILTEEQRARSDRAGGTDGDSRSEI